MVGRERVKVILVYFWESRYEYSAALEGRLEVQESAPTANDAIAKLIRNNPEEFKIEVKGDLE
jgi:hypothetical protein